MNVQCSLIPELEVYEFKLGHNATESTQNIGHAKGKDGVGHSKVPRWFKKFCTSTIRQYQVSLKSWFANPCSKR